MDNDPEAATFEPDPISTASRTPSPRATVEMDVDEDEDFDAPPSDLESEFELDEEDEWLDFDEGEQKKECASKDEMLRDLEEMLGPDEEAELWGASASHYY